MILFLLIELSEVDFSVLLVLLGHLQSQVAVFREILLLSALPNVSEVFNGLKHESSLMISELTVLSKGVEANNILAVLSQERFLFDLRMWTLLRYKEFTVLLLLFSYSLLFFFKVFLGFIYLFKLLLVVPIVSDGLIE